MNTMSPARSARDTDISRISMKLLIKILAPKPSKKEKEGFNNYLTVKPLELCKHIINLITVIQPLC